jgi:hypothetical protein
MFIASRDNVQAKPRALHSTITRCYEQSYVDPPLPIKCEAARECFGGYWEGLIMESAWQVLFGMGHQISASNQKPINDTCTDADIDSMHRSTTKPQALTSALAKTPRGSNKKWNLYETIAAHKDQESKQHLENLHEKHNTK